MKPWYASVPAGIGSVVGLLAAVIAVIVFVTGKQSLPDLLAGSERMTGGLPAARAYGALLDASRLSAVALTRPPALHRRELQDKKQLRLGFDTEKKRLSYFFLDAAQWYEQLITVTTQGQYEHLLYDSESETAVLFGKTLSFAIVDLARAEVITKVVDSTGCRFGRGDLRKVAVEPGRALAVVTSVRCQGMTSEEGRYSFKGAWERYGGWDCAPLSGGRALEESYRFKFNARRTVTSISYEAGCF